MALDDFDVVVKGRVLVTPIVKLSGENMSLHVVLSIQLSHQACGIIYHLEPITRRLFSRLMNFL